MGLSIVEIEARVTALENAAKADLGKAESWVKTMWPHAVTWLGLAYAVLKHL